MGETINGFPDFFSAIHFVLVFLLVIKTKRIVHALQSRHYVDNRLCIINREKIKKEI
jgi:hypothetical protein